MDLSKYRNKLIGSEEERAVSPVIGVILMVAITVILAAVIAAFVLDMGNSLGSEANAGVSSDVDNGNQEVSISVNSMGNAEKILLRGAVGSKVNTVDGGNGDNTYAESDDAMTKAGESITLGYGDESESGTITVVAVTEDGTETQVASEEFDFS